MEPIHLELPVVGVRFLDSAAGVEAEQYVGVSYCDAVRQATFGRPVILEPGCISTCKWSPIVLGLKSPESDFEKSLEPRMEAGTAAVCVAPLWALDGTPDVVIVRAKPGQLRDLARSLGEGSLSGKYAGQIGKTALGVGDEGLSLRAALNGAVNRSVAALKRSRTFDRVTKNAFASEKVSAFFEKLAKNAMADMSVCRNSTVLPFKEDAGNVSFFCTGGITWGGNSPACMTSGWPGRMTPEILELVDFPGRRSVSRLRAV